MTVIWLGLIDSAGKRRRQTNKLFELFAKQVDWIKLCSEWRLKLHDRAALLHSPHAPNAAFALWCHFGLWQSKSCVHLRVQERLTDSTALICPTSPHATHRLTLLFRGRYVISILIILRALSALCWICRLQDNKSSRGGGGHGDELSGVKWE